MPSACRHVAEHGVSAHGLVVLLDVVALAGVAAGDQHAVGPEGQGLQHERRVDTRPLHMTRTMRTLGAYLIRAVPAPSAARYEHQLQKKPTIFGSKVGSLIGRAV